MRGWSLAALLLAACEAASPDTGLQALLRVEGAQWVPGATPELAEGPAVLTVRNARTQVWPGQRGKALAGTLAEPATAVALMLEGDRGHWILPAGAPDTFAPQELTFTATLAFAPTLPLGPHTLLLRAVRRDGGHGPIWSEPLLAEDPAPVAGALVVSLRWDTDADLDLHVVDPRGLEIWARNINSYQAPPPGQADDPAAWREGGILDHDSNAGCNIDGRRRENVVWSQAPPAGTYLVRVDAASLCGQPAARWTVNVATAAGPIAHASGTLVEASTRGKHGPGAGLLALAFELP